MRNRRIHIASLAFRWGLLFNNRRKVIDYLWWNLKNEINISIYSINGVDVPNEILEIWVSVVGLEEFFLVKYAVYQIGIVA
jgi:hypothetical protein